MSDEPLECTACPRECRARRHEGKLGYCQTDANFHIGAICLHRGEEPLVSGRHGIVNVFFARCNLQCLYCQNYQISRTHGPVIDHRLELPEIVARIERLLDRGAKCVGFVSPSHCITQMKAIIAALRARGRRPVYLMNTSAYDKVETLRGLEGLIDVYLPDLKYMDADLAARFSDAPDYPQVAARAIREMYRQKGSYLMLDGEGDLVSGLIVRHLVLPGHIENSKRCLRFIAEELSPSVTISLLAQYQPTPQVANHPELGRRLTQAEYDEVVAEMERLGFYRGWTQSLASPECYQPDFARTHPFEGE